MIKTESARWIVEPNNPYPIPSDVQRKLDDRNRHHPVKLDLLFDEESQTWQIYKVKSRGGSAKDDILCWQISAPTRGTQITPGIFDWLEKYDTSNGGLLTKEEIEKNWLKDWRNARIKERERKEKEQAELQYRRKGLIYDLSTEKSVFGVPVTVGYNKRTGKRIMAVPRRRPV